jgi:predicted RNase H-like HicB family nuclease
VPAARASGVIKSPHEESEAKNGQHAGDGMMNLKLTEELWKEGSMYVSFCPELEIASCGETVAQAKKNLIEVILINMEEARKKGSARLHY